MKFALTAFTFFLASHLMFAQLSVDFASTIVSGNSRNEMVIDNANNLYISSTFFGTLDFDPGSGTFNLTSQSGIDPFVLKIDANGDFVNAFSFPNSNTLNHVNAIAVDANQNIYLGGKFRDSLDADPDTAGTHFLYATGVDDIFLIKIDSSGSFDWAFALGTTGFEVLRDIAVDPYGNVYITGSMVASLDINPDSSVTTTISSNGISDVLVARYSSEGELHWGHSIGSSTNDYSQSIAVDSNHVLLTGNYSGSCDFDPSASSSTLGVSGSFDAFVLALDTGGNYEWAKSMGGSNFEDGLEITISKDEDVFVAGEFRAAGDFDPGAGTLTFTPSGFQDVFVSKFEMDGTWAWSKQLHGTSSDYVKELDTDDIGGVLISGYFSDTLDADPSGSTSNMIGNSQDGYVILLDTNGLLETASQFGGSSGDRVHSALGTSSQELFVYGFTNSTTIDVDPSLGTYNLSPASSGGFVVALAPCFTSYDTISPISCGTYLSPDSNSYGTSGTYTDTILNGGGCDSIITIILTIGQNSTSSISDTVCDSYSSPSGNTYTASGTYMDTISNAVGCDSVITISLTVDSSTFNTTSAIVCGSWTSPSGNVRTISGTYLDTLTNSVGCDSIITTIVVVNNSSSSSVTTQACNSYLSPSGKLFTTGGTYSDTITNAVGCDSLITINLTIDTTTYNNLSAVACDSLRSPSGSHLWTSTGTYQDTLVNAAGCDSIITFLVVINQSQASTLTTSSCYAYTVPSGDTTYTTSGTYFDQLQTAAGCDSLIRIILTITQNTAASISESACDQYTSPSGKYTWTADGTYMDTIANSFGCDSILTITLDIDSSTSSSINPQVCESYTSPSGLYTWTTSGVYRDTLSNSVGCDSVLTINLTVDTATFANIPLVVCDSYTLPSGTVVNSNGTYHDTIANMAGCDSIMTFVLVFNQSSSSTVADTACGSYNSPSGNFIWTASGTYQDTITNAQGCDSAITFEITIKNADTAVVQTGAASLSAQANGASFQWVDCDSSFAPISGASGKNFTATQNGNYAVVVTQNGCSTRSACITITTVGLEDLIQNDITISPNPTEGFVHIELGRETLSSRVQILDSKGALVFSENFQNSSAIDLEFEGAKGLYFILLSTSEGDKVRYKLLKQ